MIVKVDALIREEGPNDVRAVVHIELDGPYDTVKKALDSVVKAFGEKNLR